MFRVILSFKLIKKQQVNNQLVAVININNFLEKGFL